MANDQARMTNKRPISKWPIRTSRLLVIRHWAFIGHSGLVIGHWSQRPVRYPSRSRNGLSRRRRFVRRRSGRWCGRFRASRRRRLPGRACPFLPARSRSSTACSIFGQSMLSSRITSTPSTFSTSRSCSSVSTSISIRRGRILGAAFVRRSCDRNAGKFLERTAARWLSLTSRPSYRPDAMVDPAAAADGVFVEQAQAGHGLARVVNLRARCRRRGGRSAAFASPRRSCAAGNSGSPARPTAATAAARDAQQRRALRIAETPFDDLHMKAGNLLDAQPLVVRPADHLDDRQPAGDADFLLQQRADADGVFGDQQSAGDVVIAPGPRAWRVG